MSAAGPTTVPFLDLGAMHQEVRGALDAAWRTTVERGSFIGGPDVDAFEREWAGYCGAPHAVGVANGTDALELALRGLGVGRGDEVIVPANTFIATAAAVVAAGAKPRFVDVDRTTLLVTPDAVAESVGPRTAAVIAVHLYGQPVDMDAVGAVARRHGLALVEDAAQAHGATWAGQRVGGLGDVAAFSFYPGKNLGALGDGGAVVTRDPELAARVRVLADHGRAGGKYRHERVGRNSRLDGLQAAVLRVKLARLDEWNLGRRRAAQEYAAHLAPLGLRAVEIVDGARSVHHLQVVRVANREAVSAALGAQGIGHGFHYPVPCHEQPAFAGTGARCPVAERAAGEVLSLPMFPHLASEQIVQVCDALGAALGRWPARVEVSRR